MENIDALNLSIITDFGCPFNCSFCITKSQKTKKDFIFDSEKFNLIKSFINNNNIKRLSISGGGEPLFNHSKEIQKFWDEIKKLNVSLHIHTNLLSPVPNINCDKFVVSINSSNYKSKFKNWENIGLVRFVHVSDGTDLELIKNMLLFLPENAQFTVKQLDNAKDIDFSEIKNILNRKNCKFLPSGDYNLYFYLNEGKFYNVFKNIKFKK